MNTAYKQPAAVKSLLDAVKLLYTDLDIAHNLNIHLGTLKRWGEAQDIPIVYMRDLCRMVLQDIKTHNLDIFYTKKKVAERCFKWMTDCLDSLGVDTKSYTFIEPSAGCGHFFDLLPVDRRIGIDIDPAVDEAMATDFLLWRPAKGNYIVVGNPPFGLRGNLALKFINHSSLFADVVAFILPQLFESDGKGAASKRVLHYELALSQGLPPNSFIYPNGQEVSVNTIFQVWTKIGNDKIKKHKKLTCDSFIKVFSLSDGGTPSSTRNKKMIGCCDVYIPSTCYSGMRAYGSFNELPNRRGYGVVIHKEKDKIKRLLMSYDWLSTAFASTNSAVNMRKSLIQNVVCKSGIHD